MGWTCFESVAAFSAFTLANRVPKWPHPNTNRTKCAFRMALGDGLPFPRPDRFLCLMLQVPNEPGGLAFPWIDLDEIDEFVVQGSSGLNSRGREVILTITQHLEPDFDPVFQPGIEYHFLFKMPGFDDFNFHYFYENRTPAGDPCEISYLSSPSSGTCLQTRTQDDPEILDVDWPETLMEPHFFFTPMSVCYDIPEGGCEDGFAAFNGEDAYIALDHNLFNTNSDFIIEAQIRLKELDHFWPLMGREGTGGFLGMDGEEFIFGNLRLATSWTPTVNTWFKWRLEFEQPLQLKYKLFIDDIEVMDRTTNRQHLQFNRLGVYKHGVSGTIWANMDMRELKFWSGDSPSTDVELDMPCDDDACDVGPDENHGTTFEMELPSCP